MKFDEFKAKKIQNLVNAHLMTDSKSSASFTKKQKKNKDRQSDKHVSKSDNDDDENDQSKHSKLICANYKKPDHEEKNC